MSIVKSTTQLLFPENHEEIYRQIHKAYSQPGRFYHTLSHVEHLLFMLGAYGSKLVSPNLVKLAILFHDYEYFMGRKDNEHLSAIYAKEAMKISGYSPESIARVGQLIDFTNSEVSYDSYAGDYDIMFLREIDHAILAAPTQVYLEYAVNIAKEAAHVCIGEDLFRINRRAFLFEFLREKKAFKLFPEWNEPTKSNTEYEYENFFSVHADYWQHNRK